MIQVKHSVIGVNVKMWELAMKDPHFQKLESVQKFALRLCTKQWNLDYESLLMICNILTLSARRKFFCLPHNIFEPRVTTLHPASDLLFSQPFAHTNSFMFSFVPFTCHAWNSLPLSIRSADCISSFKFSLSDCIMVYIHVFLAILFKHKL